MCETVCEFAFDSVSVPEANSMHQMHLRICLLYNQFLFRTELYTRFLPLEGTFLEKLHSRHQV